jgi:hypothetical protein
MAFIVLVAKFNSALYTYISNLPSYMSNHFPREEIEDDIRFDFNNHISDQDLLSSCSLLRFPCSHEYSQNYLEEHYWYTPIDTNGEVGIWISITSQYQTINYRKLSGTIGFYFA